jgi:Spy/CpxP family protein refolding chaperone
MFTLALALLLQTAAPLGPPSGGEGLSPLEQQRRLAETLRRVGMSEDGVAKLRDAGQASAREAIGLLRPAQERLTAAAAAEPFDPSAFEAALVAQRELVARLQRTQSDHQLALFRSLAPADKRVYAQLLTGRGGPAGAPER